jgi:hypothetical protein
MGSASSSLWDLTATPSPSPIDLVNEWPKKKDLFGGIFKRIVTCSLRNFSSAALRNPELGKSTVQFGNFSFPVIRYPLSVTQGTFHILLHHLLGLLLIEGASLALPHESVTLCDLIPGLSDEAALLVDGPLQVQVFCSQISHGLWVRNGFSMSQQSSLYRSSLFSFKTAGVSQRFDLDLFCLQIGSCVTHPDVTIANFLERFEISLPLLNPLPPPSFLVTKSYSENSKSVTFHVTPQPEADNPTSKWVQMREAWKDLLSLLILIVNDRQSGGGWMVSDVRGSGFLRFLRKEVIHHLMASPCSRNDLVKNLSKAFQCHPEFSHVLREVRPLLSLSLFLPFSLPSFSFIMSSHFLDNSLTMF